MTAGVTDAFRTAYSVSHVATAGGTLTDFTGAQIGPPLTFDRAGTNTVNVDVTAANRRSCTLALVDTDSLFAPLRADGPLALVNEISLYRGIVLPDRTELKPLGVFVIQAALSTSPGVITVTGIDRSKRFDVNMSKALSFAAGTSFATVFTGLMGASGIYYNTFYDPTVAVTTTPALVFNAGDNIWQQIQTAASSLGCWAYFDTAGVFTVVPVPDPDGLPIDWVYGAGTQATFDHTTRQLALEDGSQKAYSHAVVQTSVQGNVAPVRADAYDSNPASPTYYLGPFGDRPIFDSNVSSFITTLGQAQAAANALLTRNYGILERVTLQAMVNPALEGGDVLSITDPDTGTAGTYITESLPIPLFAKGGLQTITCRSRQLV